MLIADNLHGEVVLAFPQESGHVETTSHESPFDAAQSLSVEEDVCFPVDSVEVEPLLFPLQKTVPLKLVSIPEIAAEERL